MNINTKFNIGNTVFFIWKNRVGSDIVILIHIKVNGNFDIPKIEINYTIDNNKFVFPEEQLFISKELLLTYLKAE